MTEIFTFSPFGYEGNLVRVETDIRRGIPAVDIVGLADGAVKESRERMKAAVRNSGFEFPMERVLVSLSPFDLKKEGSAMDLSLALSVLVAKNGDSYLKERVIVLGELELSGKVRGVRTVHAALVTASYAGIRHAIVPKENLSEAMAVEGMKIAGVENLLEAESALRDESKFQEHKNEEENGDSEIRFPVDSDAEKNLSSLRLPKKLVRAIEIAVAGKHHLLAVGKPGCGKTLAIQSLVPLITPNLTVSESQSVTRIHSIAGLLRPNDSLVRNAPFRMPHQTASMEGMFGGGQRCRPGEISLAHNGVLFLDEAAEFKGAVLQMLRVSLESGMMSLSRAGRATCYPADIQLIMAASPCPCGNYGNKTKVCLCSGKSVAQYWNKFSAPLIDRIAVIVSIGDDEETEEVDLEQMRERVQNAFRIQRGRGAYNRRLLPQHFDETVLYGEALHALDVYAAENYIGTRRRLSIARVALTIANMEGREIVAEDDVIEAISYSKPFEQTIA